MTGFALTPALCQSSASNSNSPKWRKSMMPSIPIQPVSRGLVPKMPFAASQSIAAPQAVLAVAKNQCFRQRFGPKRCRKHWFFATAKTACGAAILWLAAKGIFGTRPLLTGWMGMLGIILFLHFGLFELLALLWQSAGVNANPVMRQPLAATSLAEFWSTRWNTAFNALAHELAFRPLARKFGAVRATLVVFLISGLVHEIVISLPARGGFGLPTAYFVFQGIGVLLERSALGRRAGLGRGFRGWLFMGIWAGAPAFWLFHPPFVTNVILPMLHPIGAK